MPLSVRRSSGPPQLHPVPKLKLYLKGAPENAVVWTEESIAALQRFLNDWYLVQEGGLPPGQSTTIPTPIEAGVDGDVGNPASGWAVGNHRHEIATDEAIGLAPDSENEEGVGSELARADHEHDMSEVMAGVMSAVSIGF